MSLKQIKLNRFSTSGKIGYYSGPEDLDQKMVNLIMPPLHHQTCSVTCQPGEDSRPMISHRFLVRIIVLISGILEGWNPKSLFLTR